jgi:hypothetical protein
MLLNPYSVSFIALFETLLKAACVLHGNEQVTKLQQHNYENNVLINCISYIQTASAFLVLLVLHEPRIKGTQKCCCLKIKVHRHVTDGVDELLNDNCARERVRRLLHFYDY